MNTTTTAAMTIMTTTAGREAVMAGYYLTSRSMLTAMAKKTKTKRINNTSHTIAAVLERIGMANLMVKVMDTDLLCA